jgi:hypothetical protein
MPNIPMIPGSLPVNQEYSALPLLPATSPKAKKSKKERER